MALAAEKLKSSLQPPRGLLAPDAANQTVVIPGNFRLMSRIIGLAWPNVLISGKRSLTYSSAPVSFPKLLLYTASRLGY